MMNRQNQRERKREQERGRRDNLKEAIEKLHNTLLEHDEDFREEASRRASSYQARTVKRTATSMINEHEQLSFTKVEIVNQAIFTLEAAVEEMKRHEKSAEEASRRGLPLPASADAKKRPAVAFHQGVGPVTMAPPTASDVTASLSTEVEESSHYHKDYQPRPRRPPIAPTSYTSPVQKPKESSSHMMSRVAVQTQNPLKRMASHQWNQHQSQSNQEVIDLPRELTASTTLLSRQHDAAQAQLVLQALRATMMYQDQRAAATYARLPAPTNRVDFSTAVTLSSSSNNATAFGSFQHQHNPAPVRSLPLPPMAHTLSCPLPPPRYQQTVVVERPRAPAETHTPPTARELRTNVNEANSKRRKTA